MNRYRAMTTRLDVSSRERATRQLAPETMDRASEIFERHGALWIERALGEALVERLCRAYLEEYQPGTAQKGVRGVMVGDRRLMVSVIVKHPFNDPDLYAAPLVYPLLTRFLGDDLLIDSFGSVCTYPGAAAQDVHVDNPPLFESATVCASLPCYAVTVAVPLVDVTTETGTTAFWEGSHRREDAEKLLRSLHDRPNYDQATLPTPRRGGVYLMDYRLIHGGTPNRSDTPRPLLYLVYSRPWFRDAYNFGPQRGHAVLVPAGERERIPPQFRPLFRDGVPV